MQESLFGPDKIKGRVRPYHVIELCTPQISFYPDKDGLVLGYPQRTMEHWIRRGCWNPNLVVYEWGAIVGKLLTVGELKYRIGGMYLEYENVNNPGDAAAIPSLDRTRDIEYYNALAGDRDYLRVALTASTFGSSNPAVFPKGNQPVFFARSAGLQGVHGLPFGHAHNSVIYGAALVAFAHETDATQDLILSAFYFPEEEQQPKLSTGQVGIEWELTLQ